MIEQRGGGGPIAASDRGDDENGQSVESGTEVGEEPKRGGIDPMAVIH